MIDQVDRLISDLDVPRTRDWLELRYADLRRVLHEARRKLDGDGRMIEYSWALSRGGFRVVSYHIGRWMR